MEKSKLSPRSGFAELDLTTYCVPDQHAVPFFEKQNTFFSTKNSKKKFR